jgi:L-rhamnose isomerase
MVDSVESKLFGIGSESFVVGSSEFYLAYAISKKIMLCMDMGHYHPTESVADKISSVLLFANELMLHISRSVRWDSDHVVIFSDDLKELCNEVIRANVINKVNFGLDFFDASINRIGAWVTGTRSLQKSLLFALLEPVKKLREYEKEGKLFERLALMEENKNKPFGAVWDYYCLSQGVPCRHEYISEIQEYEKAVLGER